MPQIPKFSPSLRNEILEIMEHFEMADINAFFDVLERISASKEWKIREMRTINKLIKDNLGYVAQTIYRDRLPHPGWDRHYRGTEFEKPDHLKSPYHCKPLVQKKNDEPTYTEFVETRNKKRQKKKSGKTILIEDTIKHMKVTI